MVKSISTKGQIWSIDLTIAFFIFFLGLLIIYYFSIDYTGYVKEDLNTLLQSGDFLSNNLMSEGTPVTWTEQNFLIPGVESGGKLNSTKLAMLYNLAQANYTTLRRKLNTEGDFYIFLNKPFNASGPMVDGVGKPGINRTNIFQMQNITTLTKVTRIIANQNKVDKLTIYIWK